MPNRATMKQAWRVLVQDNPLPAVMGRVCYHPCESKLQSRPAGSAVGINSVERFLGDEAIKRGWKFDAPATASGKKVLVVGAGPSGLSAAYHLARLGHAVEIHEAGPLCGRHDALSAFRNTVCRAKCWMPRCSASSIWA